MSLEWTQSNPEFYVFTVFMSAKRVESCMVVFSQAVKV